VKRTVIKNMFSRESKLSVNFGCRIWWELIDAASITRKVMSMSVRRNSGKIFSEVKEIILVLGGAPY
jgi:hypothetical protein